MKWRDILSRWLLIENDMQDRGIDLDNPAFRGRSGRWLRVRIIGLLSADTRLARSFAPSETESKAGEP